MHWLYGTCSSRSREVSLKELPAQEKVICWISSKGMPLACRDGGDVERRAINCSGVEGRSRVSKCQLNRRLHS